MFVPLIDEVPKDFEVLGPDPEHRVLSALAESDDCVRIVSVRTCLIPFERDGVLWHELKFGIAVTGDEADEAFVMYDRDMAKGFLPKGIRPLVLPCVRGAIEALIGAVRPDLIFRVTHATRPPEKALQKHHMITNVLATLGYAVVQEETDRFGRRFWTMVR